MLGGLTSYGRFYYPHIFKSFKEGYRAKTAYSTIAKYEPTYRWGQFRRDWGIARRAFERSERMKYVTKQRIASEESYIPSPFHRKKNYYTVMKVHVWDKELQKEDYIHVTVTHDIRLPRYELEEDVRVSMIEPSPRFEYLASAPAIGYRRSA